MLQYSPTLEGFRTMFRRPSFGLAEMAWRWSFGFAAGLLLAYSGAEYLHTLPVTGRDLFLLRTRHPALVWQALAHILRGSGPRLIEALMVAASAMAVAWIGMATLGRAVTIRALLSYLPEEHAGDAPAAKRWRMASLAGLNFLRVAVTLAAAVGCLAAWRLGGAVSPDKDPSPGSATLVFLALVMLVWLAWSMMNWFLSLAAVIAVTRGKNTLGAMAAAVDLCRARGGSLAAASTWFGLTHLAGFVMASSVVAVPLAFLTVLPGSVVVGGVLLVGLLYFALADFLYVGRLAAYAAIAESPEAPPVPQVFPPPPDRTQSTPRMRPPADSRVDPEELILSDLPVPARD
jgi:hypothetical protein